MRPDPAVALPRRVPRALGAVRRTGPVPRDHRPRALPVRLGAVPLLLLPAARAGRRAARRVLPAPAADRAGLGGAAAPPGALAGRPRRVAGAVPRGGPDPADADPAPLRPRRLERAAPRPVRGPGVPAAGGVRARRTGRRPHRRRVPARRTAATRPVPRHVDRAAAGPRADLHHPRPARALGPRMVSGPGAARREHRPHRPPATPSASSSTTPPRRSPAGRPAPRPAAGAAGTTRRSAPSPARRRAPTRRGGTAPAASPGAGPTPGARSAPGDRTASA